MVRGVAKINRTMVSFEKALKRYLFLHGHMSLWKQFTAGTLCFELVVWDWQIHMLLQVISQR